MRRGLVEQHFAASGRDPEERDLLIEALGAYVYDAEDPSVAEGFEEADEGDFAQIPPELINTALMLARLTKVLSERYEPPPASARESVGQLMSWNASDVAVWIEQDFWKRMGEGFTRHAFRDPPAGVTTA